jgi:hypothetical protein
MSKITKVIAGIPVTLEAGQRYRAEGDVVKFSVDIRELGADRIVDRLTASSSGQVREFVNAFNNQASSYTGRCWTVG